MRTLDVVAVDLDVREARAAAATIVSSHDQTVPYLIGMRVFMRSSPYASRTPSSAGLDERHRRELVARAPGGPVGALVGLVARASPPSISVR